MRAVDRPDAAELLRQGLPNAEVARRLGMSPRTVRAVRTHLGLDRVTGRGAVTRTLEEAYRVRTVPLGDGHLGWAGARGGNGAPFVRFGGRRTSAYRVAFRAHFGREPEGVVMPVCDVKGCVAGPCMDDESARRRTRAQLAALMGLGHRQPTCSQGHLYAETAEYRANGKRECGACRVQHRQELKAVAA
ncbi:helix-turn-helix domain-containing protein [Streptomyces platensis]|uniref:helix-turn-helix domain-containing protein n=1 Tax=Streptomyces platensis TaxID=58346 RepID=UPI00332C0913